MVLFFQVKSELERVKSAMLRLKQIQDKSKRGQVDQAAAKRFITSGLWKPGEAKAKQGHKGAEGNKRHSGESDRTASDNTKKAKMK